MRRILITLICSSVLTAVSALAQDGSSASANQPGEYGNAPSVVTNDHNNQAHQQPGTEAALPATSVTQAQPVAPKTINDEVVGITPQIGDVNFKDATSASTNRALYGVALDWNVMHLVDRLSSTPAPKGLYFGPSTGFFFSHVGAVGGSFFGDNSSTFTALSTVGSDPGANLFFLPTDLKLGYTFMDKLRISAHAGGNVLFRSNSGSAQIGVNAPLAPIPKWGFLPNAGLDVEYGFASGVAAIFRPDWTFGGSNGMFAGTLGVMIPIT